MSLVRVSQVFGVLSRNHCFYRNHTHMKCVNTFCGATLGRIKKNNFLVNKTCFSSVLLLVHRNA